MGLNLNIRYVFFDSLRKYDGREYRELASWELGQIAGRAGRFRKDGFFGLTSNVAQRARISLELISSIEKQSFRANHKIQYRNSDFDFSSVLSLQESLQKPSFSSTLVSARTMEDEHSLIALSRLSDMQNLCSKEVSLLWDVCRVPDYRQESTEKHQRFQAILFRQLREGFLDSNWIARSVHRISSTKGEINALMQRIAQVRTWSYIAYRASWVEHSKALQERLKRLEEDISFALHKKLSDRFIDYRASKMVQYDKPREVLRKDYELHCSQCMIGKMENFSFSSTIESNRRFGLKKSNALGRAFFKDSARELFVQVQKEQNFQWMEGHRIGFEGVGIAYLSKGKRILEPKIHPFSMDLLDPAQKRTLIALLKRWLQSQVETLQIQKKSKRYKGVLYLVQEHLGVVSKKELGKEHPRLNHKILSSLGLGQTREYLFFRVFLKPRLQLLRLVLLSCWYGERVSNLIPGNRVSVTVEWSEKLAKAMGWLPLGKRMVRIDIAF